MKKRSSQRDPESRGSQLLPGLRGILKERGGKGEELTPFQQTLERMGLSDNGKQSGADANKEEEIEQFHDRSRKVLARNSASLPADTAMGKMKIVNQPRGDLGVSKPKSADSMEESGAILEVEPDVEEVPEDAAG